MKKGIKKGFTIIELSLSIAFIAILSITVVLIINNTLASYRRGLTLNQLNTTGMDLVDDLRAAVQNSPTSFVEDVCTKVYYDQTSAKNKCINTNAKNFVSITKTGTVKIDGKEKKNVPLFGVFCTGSYSYIWNSGYFMNSINSDYTVVGVSAAKLKYKDSSGTVKEFPSGSDVARLIKIEDNDRDVCVSVTKTAAAKSGYKYTVTNGNIENVVNISGAGYSAVPDEPFDDLATDKNSTLVLYDLTASTAANVANNTLFYSVSFVLGTIQGGIDVKAAGNNCAVPTDYKVENFDYCSINKFNFAAQANGA